MILPAPPLPVETMRKLGYSVILKMCWWGFTVCVEVGIVSPHYQKTAEASSDCT